MTYKLFNDEDTRILQGLIDREKAGRINNIRSDSERSFDAGEDHQAPETYIGIPQTGTGIPALEEVGTSGPGEGDIPGSEMCDIYRVVGTELKSIGLEQRVYNISSTALTQSWIPVTRDKFGNWVALGGGGSIELSHGIILEPCQLLCSTYRVKRIHRYLTPDCDDTGTATGSP